MGYCSIYWNQWYANAHNGKIKGVRYFETDNGKGFFVRLEQLIENLGTCPKLIEKEWNMERLLWIGFYKNNNNEYCFVRKFPKVIVYHVLCWLRMYAR